MNKIKEFLIASNNKKKLIELKTIFEPYKINVLSPADVGGIPEVEETGCTFEENAVLKATKIAALTGKYVFADDSGLEVEALGNKPGVYSARYAGPGASDADRISKLLEELRFKNNRKAHFVCVIAISSPSGEIRTYRGEVYGRIIDTPRGGLGFGYDPIFVPDGFEQTFAELSAEIKNKISHRAKAIAKALSDEKLLTPNTKTEAAL